jgi:hypothetical protein
VILAAALLSIASIASIASAQTAPEPSADDREAAGEAYDRGTAAYLARDYQRAASLFETAYRLAPNSAALIQAVRAHDRAGDHLRAASLALRLQARHGDDRQAVRQAETTLREASRSFLRVDVTCDADCTVELDGRLEDHPSFFVDPASAHTVRASFDTGAAEPQATSGAAGETQAMSFARPAPAPEPEPVVVVVAPPVEEPDPIAPPPPSSGGISPAVFVTALALTAVAGGVLIWSGVDTLDGLPAYQADPTIARLQDGQARELRTNVMIGVTGALAITTLVLAIVTDWDGDPAASETATPVVSAVITPEGGIAFAQGRF